MFYIRAWSHLHCGIEFATHCDHAGLFGRCSQSAVPPGSSAKVQLLHGETTQWQQKKGRKAAKKASRKKSTAKKGGRKKAARKKATRKRR